MRLVANEARTAKGGPYKSILSRPPLRIKNGIMHKSVLEIFLFQANINKKRLPLLIYQF
jgi:hypothetical protein